MVLTSGNQGSREIRTIGLEDAFEVLPLRHGDARGILTKPYVSAELAERGLIFDLHEMIWSESTRGVIRGLHFQVPPSDGAKFVYCVSGVVRDVMVDLRVGSPSYGEWAAVDLSSDVGNAVYVPTGFAHGFEVLSDTAIVTYGIDVAFDPAADGGIRWDSLGIDWRTTSPILSEKDKALPLLGDFVSPFSYEPKR